MEFKGTPDNPIHQIMLPYCGAVFVWPDPFAGRLYVKPQTGMKLYTKTLESGEVVIDLIPVDVIRPVDLLPAPKKGSHEHPDRL